MFEGFDLTDIVIGLLALGLTGVLGYAYKKAGVKVDDAIALIEYMVEAGKDRQFSKDELQEIWRRIKKLKGSK